MIDKEQLAHELALEYVRKTSSLSPTSAPPEYVDVYFDALESILGVINFKYSDYETDIRNKTNFEDYRRAIEQSMFPTKG